MWNYQSDIIIRKYKTVQIFQVYGIPLYSMSFLHYVIFKNKTNECVSLTLFSAWVRGRGTTI